MRTVLVYQPTPYDFRIRLDDYENPTAETFLTLAKALKVHPNELYQAAGYLEEHTHFSKGPAKTLEENIAGIEIQESVNIPVVDDVAQLNYEVSDVGQYATWGFPGIEKENVRGLLVRNFLWNQR